jgi:hypothetical protein
MGWPWKKMNNDAEVASSRLKLKRIHVNINMNVAWALRRIRISAGWDDVYLPMWLSPQHAEGAGVAPKVVHSVKRYDVVGRSYLHI